MIGRHNMEFDHYHFDNHMLESYDTGTMDIEHFMRPGPTPMPQISTCGIRSARKQAPHWQP